MEVVAADWAQLSESHFGAAVLGDARRTKRLVKTAGKIMAYPGGSLPDKLPDWADLTGLYRLVAAEAVTHGSVIRPHLDRTLGLMREAEGVVLLVSDTTELDYTDHEAVASGLGQIGNGGRRGYLCHSTLAVTPDRRVLGLASQVLHRRRTVAKKETAKQKREHQDRESRLWQKGCEATGPVPAGARWVDVCDRGSDAWEFLEFEHAAGRKYVIRSAKDRALDGDDHVGSDRVHRTLHGYARDLPTVGTKSVQVGASTKKGSKARTAVVGIAAGPVTLAAPKQPRGQCSAKTLDLWVVHVREVDPPADVTPLEWVLLTDVPADTPERAAERVDWYEARPVVEDYHKGMKTGVGIELPQFESADRLEPVIGLLSVVSVVLLTLRHMARAPETRDTPAEKAVPKLWTKLIAAKVYKSPGRDLTVNEFFVGVARLGGHLARKNDGPPGWLTLWRGWGKLHQMIAGAEIALGRCV